MSKKKSKIEILDPIISEEDLEKQENGEFGSDLVKSIVNTLNSRQKITRLTFQEDPVSPHKYAGIYYDKVGVLPDSVIKKIAIVDDLVASIVHARGQHARPFGHKLQDRFSTGFRIEPKFKDSGFSSLSEEQKKNILKRAEALENRLVTCGETKNWDEEDKMSLSTFLYISACNAVKFGRFATEVIHVGEGDNRRPYAFRPADPSTIYKAVPHTNSAESIRKAALNKLKSIKNENLIPEKVLNDEYTWFQVINGTPQQALTSEEMIVHNCYPVTDYELNGYPLTPIDTVISAITTHINITNHNKLYFQHGRASKGMLVINSDEVDQATLADLKQQFNAAINSVSNSWRLPVIKTGKEDKVTWSPIDSGSRDMEFQYLSDDTKRVILAAFQISPDELPGYNHLSKGTNTQSLSDSNNEYKLEAARDVGIRPLLANLQDFLNTRILPLFDPEVAQYCTLKLHGLDAETAEKENTRLQEEQQIYETYNGILRRVEKQPIPKMAGGDVPLSPGWQGIADKYLTVGYILEHFFGIPDASKNPNYQYIRDPFWFQQQQVLLTQKMQEEQAKIAQQQVQQGEDQKAGAQGPDGQPIQQPEGQQQQMNGSVQNLPKNDSGNEIQSGIDQILQSMSKSEAHFTVNKKKLLAQHAETVKSILDDWENESKKVLAEIAATVDKNKRSK